MEKDKLKELLESLKDKKYEIRTYEQRHLCGNVNKPGTWIIVDNG